MIKERSKALVLIIVGIAIIGTIAYLESLKVSQGEIDDASSLTDVVAKQDAAAIGKAERFEVAKEITTPDGFINTDGITIEDQIGEKVVLVDFWTYSCINCQRTLPYLNAWHKKYSDEGLVILGLHTPEFEFEKDYANVQDAVERFDIAYPVILDNDFSTWRAYNNRYWPRKYLIDIDGYIVYDHIGEGAYDETERVIQELLAERSKRLSQKTTFATTLVAPEKTESTEAQSPEIYFGAWRNDLLGNGKTRVEGKQEFVLPETLSGNTLYFTGPWHIETEYAGNEGTGSIVFAYNAKKVHMVASGDGTPVEATVLVDGNPPLDLAGKDVSADGSITFNEERLYNLIDDPKGSAIHVIEIQLETTGLQAYTLTFG